MNGDKDEFGYWERPWEMREPRMETLASLMQMKKEAEVSRLRKRYNTKPPGPVLAGHDLLLLHEAIATVVSAIKDIKNKSSEEIRGELFTRLRTELPKELHPSVFRTDLKTSRSVLWQQWSYIDMVIKQQLEGKEETADDVLSNLRIMLRNMEASVNTLTHLNESGGKVVRNVEQIDRFLKGESDSLVPEKASEPKIYNP